MDIYLLTYLFIYVIILLFSSAPFLSFSLTSRGHVSTYSYSTDKMTLNCEQLVGNPVQWWGKYATSLYVKEILW